MLKFQPNRIINFEKNRGQNFGKNGDLDQFSVKKARFGNFRQLFNQTRGSYRRWLSIAPHFWMKMTAKIFETQLCRADPRIGGQGRAPFLHP